MSSKKGETCPHCKKNYRQLAQHLAKTKLCNAKWTRELTGQLNELGYCTAIEFNPPVKLVAGLTAQEERQLRQFPANIQVPGQLPEIYETAMEESEDNEGAFPMQDSDNSLGTHDNSSVTDASEFQEIYDTTIDETFKVHLRKAAKFLPMNKDQVEAIKLLTILRRTKASLNTYETVCEWHFRANGDIKSYESLKDCDAYIPRGKLFKFLRKRYNMEEKYGIPQKIVLPYSRAGVQLMLNDTKAVFESLLTDPRVRDSDYAFWDPEDPFSVPPANLDCIEDLTTGLCFRKTWQKLIGDRGIRAILLPTPMHIDGTATGQFANLEVTQLKMTLGFWSREARDRPHFWRVLGYIPTVIKAKSRGKRILVEDNHVEAVREHEQMMQNEGLRQGVINAVPAQDYHAMLDAILAKYREIQQNGFTFDFRYKGKLCEGVEFIPFVPFIKCDTKEANTLCGAFQGGNSKNVCRYCECPRNASDNPLADYPKKTVNSVGNMINAHDAEGLMRISQQNIQNAWYKIRFGFHNKQGIHGACPMEMLHALQLGLFQCARECFFEQIGPKSECAKEINALSREYGALLSRQSERDKPKTTFSAGILSSKLMAKECTGVLLCVLAILRSKCGRSLLKKRPNFKQPGTIKDWILLVETLLEWESWMRSRRMMKNHVKRARQKHRCVPYLIKKIGKRTKGMGFKIAKFHLILHIVDDILANGVPLEVDTGSNEEGHKPTKSAAKLTQKNEETFNEQTAKRPEETHLIDLANEEIAGRPLWNYRNGFYDDSDEEEADNKENEASAEENEASAEEDEADDEDDGQLSINSGQNVTSTRGCEMKFFFNPRKDRNSHRIISHMKDGGKV